MDNYIDAKSLLIELYQADAENCFDDHALGKMLDRPIVGIADANDPWFIRLKEELIGDFYWTPQEALELVDSKAQARSVISWYMPISQVAREANAKEKEIAARPWAYVRTFGEKLNTRLRHGMEDRLSDMGFAAFAPAVAPECIAQDRFKGLSACWSERHTAMVAGLGTFGISGGLITEQGIAHRLGSVVTDAFIQPTVRPYGDDPFAWCLRTAHGKCGTCILRCPACSIGETVQERDKKACQSYLDGIGVRGKEIYGWEGTYGCGLCQTAVPCEHCNPTA